MANDRVIIRCDYCGGWKMLLKHFATSGPTTRDNGILEWLDTHRNCGGQIGMDELPGPGFSLHTESAIGSELDPEKQNKRGHSAPQEDNPSGIEIRGNSWRDQIGAAPKTPAGSPFSAARQSSSRSWGAGGRRVFQKP